MKKEDGLVRLEKQLEGLKEDIYLIESAMENAANHKEEKELSKKHSRMTKKIKKLCNKIDSSFSSQNR